MTYSLPQLGYEFADSIYLQRAITHKSYHNEFGKKGDSVGNNEKLEFLGDSVLDLALSMFLIKVYPDLNEGALSKVRASLVNEESLCLMAKNLELDNYILLGRGESKMNGAKKPRLLASCFEAVIGAIFSDSGYDSASYWVEKVFSEKVKTLDLSQFYATDYKTSLQEAVQKNYKMTPTYNLLKQEGPDHERMFFSEVVVEDYINSNGQGKTKKASEQMAAKNALEKL